MFCSKCGAEIPENKKYCPDCGAFNAKYKPISNESVNEEISSQNDDEQTMNSFAVWLVAFFFGWLGIHNFATKAPVKGCLKIILTSIVIFTTGVDERVELFRDVVCIGLLAWIAYDLFSMVQNNKLYPTVGYVSSILYVAFALCMALMFIPKDLSEPSDKEKEVTKNELSEILQKGNALSIVGTRVVLFGFVKSIEKEKVLINVGDTTEIGIVDEIKDVVEEKIESVKRILEEENSSSDSLLSNNSKKDIKVVPAYLKFAVDELPYNSIKKGAIIRVSCISRGFEKDLLVFDMCKFIQ